MRTPWHNKFLSVFASSASTFFSQLFQVRTCEVPRTWPPSPFGARLQQAIMGLLKVGGKKASKKDDASSDREVPWLIIVALCVVVLALAVLI